jgi:hypothetical protein
MWTEYREPDHVAGMPIYFNHGRLDEEGPRVLGFSHEYFGPVDTDFFASVFRRARSLAARLIRAASR